MTTVAPCRFCGETQWHIGSGALNHGVGKCVPRLGYAEEAEQAFWDACVASHVGGLAGSGATFAAVVRDACDMADVLVAERRKRIAARAKGG